MVRTVRFLAGLALVVVGIAMAAPFLTRIAEVLMHASDAGGAGAVSAWGAAPEATGVPPVPLAPPAGPGAYAIPDSRGTPAPAAGAGLVPPPDAGPVMLPMPAPAPAPAPVPVAAETRQLPAPPTEVSLAPPAFPSTYRSTLDVPPPPLLDVDGAAPLVVSGAGPDAIAAVALSAGAPGPIRPVSVEVPAEPREWRAAAASPLATAPPPQPLAVPDAALAIPAPIPAAMPASTSHVVRDGDDLTGIATRFYGHPGAAEAIWNANRDRLADPSVLPIGVSLRLPSWTPPVARPADARGALEPAPRPARVKVGPGETLETLAQRFYGDKAWADRLWEANRDQLRNPRLLVAGMELRLP